MTRSGVNVSPLPCHTVAFLYLRLQYPRMNPESAVVSTSPVGGRISLCVLITQDFIPRRPVPPTVHVLMPLGPPSLRPTIRRIMMFRSGKNGSKPNVTRAGPMGRGGIVILGYTIYLLRSALMMRPALRKCWVLCTQACRSHSGHS